MSVDTRVVVGLGNPGEKYRYTRHNIAWLILDAFADRVNWRGGGKERDASMVHAGRVLGLDLVVAKPITYMNESGIAVRKLLAADRVSIDRLLVVVDDFSLPFGRLRFREGGSDGGHNGLASIEAELQTDRYPRLRVGIGDPSDSGGAHQHVLNEFSAAERLRIPEVARASRRIARVADCHVADQIVQDRAGENLGHEAHALVLAELLAVAGDDARALLAAVLQGVEAVVGEFGGVGMAVNAKDAAIMFGIVG